MPSPIGHLLAGVAAAWTADLVPGNRDWRSAPVTAGWYARAGGGFTAVCGALAAAPDLDLFFGGHRTVTHSLTAAVVVGLCAAAAAAATRRPIARVALTCTLAYATHLLLDLLGADPVPPEGIQLLWPFSRAWFISGWNVFEHTERRHLFSAFSLDENAKAIFREVLILVPVAAMTWLVRVKALAGLSTELARRDHPTQ
jgi:membrane-bound metal-dependent hydrolase YbcI (DUF457 family)